MSLVYDIAYVEFYVNDLEKVDKLFRECLGFEIINKQSNQVSFLYNSIKLIFKTPKTSSDMIYDFLNHHGSAAAKISFFTKDILKCVNNSLEFGKKIIDSPKKNKNLKATIEFSNGLFFEFLDGREYDNPLFFLEKSCNEKKSRFEGIDHIALCVNKNEFSSSILYFQKALNLIQTRDEEGIYSIESGMSTTVVSSKNGKIKFPIVAPLSNKSPLTSFLKEFNGSGMHHIAFSTNNIISTLENIDREFLKFLHPPLSYYQDLSDKEFKSPKELEILKHHGILYDEKNKGYLLQIFSKPIFERSTIFLEFIERKNNSGFGNRNIKSLYESLEQLK